MHIVDSSGWLEFFTHSSNASHFISPILDTKNLLVPTIILYEVYKKMVVDLGEPSAYQAVANMKLGRVIDVTEQTALYAAHISVEKKLPMADSLIYAAAVLHEAILYTQDIHFEGLPLVKYFKKS